MRRSESRRTNEKQRPTESPTHLAHRSWDEHQEVKKALKPTFEDDGIFHISYADFCKNYRKVDVCKREVSARTDMYLDVDEKEGCIGPLKACCQGCGIFWTGEGCKKTCGRKVRAL